MSWKEKNCPALEHTDFSVTAFFSSETFNKGCKDIADVSLESFFSVEMMLVYKLRPPEE